LQANRVDTFQQELRKFGDASLSFNDAAFLISPGPPFGQQHARDLPRIVMDQLVNIFFQEWAPIYPVLHRPTFLAFYDSYFNGQGDNLETIVLVQIYLVVLISAHCRGVSKNYFFKSAPWEHLVLNSWAASFYRPGIGF
jgi:hypothetical protein